MKTNRFNPRHLFALGMLHALPPHAFAFKDDPDDEDGGGGGGDGDDPGTDSPPDDSGKGKVHGGDDSERKAFEDRLKAIEIEREKERKELEKLRKAEKERGDASKSELEKLQEKAAEESRLRLAAEERANRLQIDAAIRDAAAEAGARPERIAAILRIVDRSGVTLGEDGAAVGAAAAILSAKAEVPELFGGASTAAGDSGKGKPPDRGSEPETDYDVGRELVKASKNTDRNERL